MSLKQSIARFKKPIGSGCARSAYYSKKYDVVVKLPNGGNSYCENQSRNEIEFFEKLEEKYRKYLPIVDYFQTKRGLAIVMKKVTPIDEFLGSLTRDDDFYEKRQLISRIVFERFSSFDKDEKKLLKEMGISLKSIEMVNEIKLKYQLRDFHRGNFGLATNGDVVIIDAGYHNDR